MGLFKCVKLIFLFLISIIGLTGTFLVFFGGVKVYTVDPVQAKQDGVHHILSDFLSCEDEISASNFTKGTQVYDIVLARCVYKQSATTTVVVFGGIFTLFAVLSGMMSNCRDVKGNMYCYTVISGVAISLLVVGMMWMNYVTTHAATKLLPCSDLSVADLTELRLIDPDVICWGGSQEITNDTAALWFSRVAIFYVGCGLSLASLVVFLLLNACTYPQLEKPSEDARVPLRGNHNYANSNYA